MRYLVRPGRQGPGRTRQENAAYDPGAPRLHTFRRKDAQSRGRRHPGASARRQEHPVLRLDQGIQGT